MAGSLRQFRFNNTNYEYTNANAGTSAHHCKDCFLCTADLANMAKNDFLKGALVAITAKMTRKNKGSKMKRHGNLYDKIASIDNLMLADKKACRGKARQPGVIAHKEHREENIASLHASLINKQFNTAPYTIFTVTDRKTREVFRRPAPGYAY